MVIEIPVSNCPSVLRALLPSYNGDDREPYNSLRAAKRAKVFQQLSLEQIIAVLLYWENMNNAFVQRYEKLYEAVPDAQQLFQNGEGWISTIEDVAESRVHGIFLTYGALTFIPSGYI